MRGSCGCYGGRGKVLARRAALEEVVRRRAVRALRWREERRRGGEAGRKRWE